MVFAEPSFGTYRGLARTSTTEAEALINLTPFGEKRHSVNWSEDSNGHNTCNPNNLNPSQNYEHLVFVRPQPPSVPPPPNSASALDTGCQDDVPGRPPSINPELRQQQCPWCNPAGGGP
eukprot:3140293-Rhodomonas_salina.1